MLAAEARYIVDSLAAWARENSGSVKIAVDFPHLWDLLSMKPGAPRIGVLYRGETLRGEFDVAAALGRVDRHFWVVVSRGRGFKLEPGEAWTDGQAGGKPMFELVEEAVNVVRCLAIPGMVENPVDYRATNPFDAAPYRADAMQVEFSYVVDLPQLTADANQGENP